MSMMICDSCDKKFDLDYEGDGEDLIYCNNCLDSRDCYECREAGGEAQ